MRKGRTINFAWILARMFALSVLLMALGIGCRKKPSGGGGPPGGFTASVIAVEARTQSLAETLAVVGTLVANESVEVKSEVDGTIAEILFEEGQPVKKGALLIRLDETKLTAALGEAEANLKLSQSTYERNQQLLRERLVSQQEYDQAASLYQANIATVELRRRQLQDTRIHAPFSGIAGSRLVSPGQVIARNTTLTWLVDLETLKAEFNVPERFIGQIEVGQRISVAVAAYPKDRFEGEVYFLAPHVDPATRTLLVKARLPNEKYRLKPGMFASLDLTLTLRENAVVIPESALMSMGERTSVYIVSATNTAQMRPIQVGLRMPNLIEVLRGVQPGERVITEGVQKVRPGGAVKIATPDAAPSATNVVRRS